MKLSQIAMKEFKLGSDDMYKYVLLVSPTNYNLNMIMRIPKNKKEKIEWIESFRLPPEAQKRYIKILSALSDCSEN